MKYKQLDPYFKDFIYSENSDSFVLSLKYNPHISSNGYWEVKINSSIFKVHRIIYKLFNPDFDENLTIDHIDGNRLNNKIENLRAVSHAENMRNKSKYKSSKTGVNGITMRCVKGVNYLRVYVRINGVLSEKYVNINNNGGYVQAMQVALQIREELESSLFTERHGK